MPTASPRRVSRLRCCFYSSTNVCAGLSPTAASTTSRTSNTAQTASSNSPTTAPTKQSNTSSICSPPPDLLVVNVELFLSRSCEARIYSCQEAARQESTDLRPTRTRALWLPGPISTCRCPQKSRLRQPIRNQWLTLLGLYKRPTPARENPP